MALTAGPAANLSVLVEAIAAAVRADVVLLRAVEPDGRSAAVRALAAASPALVAELEGSRVPVGELPASESADPDALPQALRGVAARIAAEGALCLPLGEPGRPAGSLELLRRDGAFSAADRALARLAAAAALVALRALRGGRRRRRRPRARGRRRGADRRHGRGGRGRRGDPAGARVRRRAVLTPAPPRERRAAVRHGSRGRVARRAGGRAARPGRGRAGLARRAARRRARRRRDRRDAAPRPAARGGAPAPRGRGLRALRRPSGTRSRPSRRARGRRSAPPSGGPPGRASWSGRAACWAWSPRRTPTFR